MARKKQPIGLFWRELPKVETKRQPPEPVWLAPDYLPYFKEASEFQPDLFTDAQLVEESRAGNRLVFDIESYINYALIVFKSVTTGKIAVFERTESHHPDYHRLTWIAENFTLVSFNGLSYDEPILNMFARGCTAEQMKAATNMLISDGIKPRDLYRKVFGNKYKKLKIDHIDLIEVAPLKASLKIYAGRLNCRKMQSLPFPHGATLSYDQIVCLRYYCVKDTDDTILLLNTLKGELELRQSMSKEYGLDLRSKSDAQIAEAVLVHEIQSGSGNRPETPFISPGTVFRYKRPAYMRFQTPMLNSILERVLDAGFELSEKGKIIEPDFLKAPIVIGESEYRLGIGGIHSSEKSRFHFAGPGWRISDVDVASYYPNIILLLRLFPPEIGEIFLEVYRSIVERRLRAKGLSKSEDLSVAEHYSIIADSLKITINGSFGKLGSKYSSLFAPDLLVQVTLTGQLSILMLIECYELCGMSVVSANTDGIVVKYRDEQADLFHQVMEWWQKETKYELEENRYKILASRDVNNYFAFKLKYDKSEKIWLDEIDGKAKRKGCYAAAGLRKNPLTEICTDAVVEFLSKGTPVEETIRSCEDVFRFVVVRSVTKGAVKQYGPKLPPHASKAQLIATVPTLEQAGDGWWRIPAMDDEGEPIPGMTILADEADAYRAACGYYPPAGTEYLGKAIRFYYGRGELGAIVNAETGDTIPTSAGAVPLMESDGTLPADIDYDRYIEITTKILADIGYHTAPYGK